MKQSLYWIMNRINQIWLGADIKICDNDYWLPALDELTDFIRNNYFEKYKWSAEFFDCDDFAQILNAYVTQERYRQLIERQESRDNWLRWAFFECWGSRFHGQDMGHAVNGCICSDGNVYLIEPQNDNIWVAEKGRDFVHFIKF